uniref:Acetyltransferase n=1 Tax=uncultured bacterium URE12 TaxID=581111 RepID=C0JZR9_9BACT|nr:acetyltransferase [uncultured bacterium URE12]
MEQVLVRKAATADLADILAIYAQARKFMREHGNPDQWKDNRPSEKTVINDILKRNCYIIQLCSTERNGLTKSDDEKITVVGVFAFITGNDPTYSSIDGAWHSDKPYGTIHRLASAGITGGIAKTCFDYCSKRISYLRIDTHEANTPMYKAVLDYGFRKCGTIITDNGTPRTAFDFINRQ